MTQSLNEIASAWIDYISRRHPLTGDLKNVSVSDLGGKDDAAQKLLDFVVNDQDAALHVIESVLSQTSDPWILENVGAGPLEDLLHGGNQETVQVVLALVQKYPNAVEALKSAWTQDCPSLVREAVQRILSERS